VGRTKNNYTFIQVDGASINGSAVSVYGGSGFTIPPSGSGGWGYLGIEQGAAALQAPVFRGQF
jgi:hypothetical protein